MKPGLRVLALGAAGLVAASANPVRAQAEPARAGAVQRLVDCQKIPDDTARLGCYDQAVRALDQAEAGGEVVVIDRDQARHVRRQAFGFSLPAMTLFERGEAREELESVTGRIASARQDSTGRWVLRLEDGAVWAQADTAMGMLAPKPGMEVRVRRASLGSFLLSVEGRRAYRARRVE